MKTKQLQTISKILPCLLEPARMDTVRTGEDRKVYYYCENRCFDSAQHDIFIPDLFSRWLVIICFLLISHVMHAQITLSSPNGGEVWAPGSQQTISWYNLTGFGSLPRVILYSSDNGNTWIPIDTVPGNIMSYSWTVPNTPSNQCLVRIMESATAYDDSNSNFTISIAAGIENNNRENIISIYPNPASDFFIITNNNPSEGITGITLYDIAGKRVTEFTCEQFSEPAIKISIGNFSAGTYFVAVSTLSKTECKKIVITN